MEVGATVGDVGTLDVQFGTKAGIDALICPYSSFADCPKLHSSFLCYQCGRNAYREKRYVGTIREYGFTIKR